MPRQPMHQVQEIGQVLGPRAPLIDRQDEPPALGLQQEVGILDPLGDALEDQGRAQVEAGQELLQLGVGDVGIDGHPPVICDVARRVKV